ncbi:hypothetical protein DKX38_002386 [Salix brachista]|uniref:Zinc finger Sec23/Sec24-type domain-containing protein n=1 Tax=Salix brachista TaxID=2182728 RepID=A0A5N5NPE3_9ROSI|nr:hypothetical protein DKX38_002386 [Salix brachista]
MERILAHDELEARPNPSSPDQQKPTPPESEHPNPTARFDFLLQSPKTGAVSNGMPSVSGSMPGGPRFPLFLLYAITATIFYWRSVAPPFLEGSQGALPPPGPPFGAQTWSLQPQQFPHFPGSMQPPTKFGTPPHLANQGMMAISPAMGQNGASLAGQPKMDSKSVPCPTPTSESIYHETRLNNQANPPPVVDFGESGPVRCSRCKGYINPFKKFIDHGRRFICNFCGFADETPSDYQCNLGPDGRRRDADERPELCRGTVKFVASKEYIHGQLSKRDF